MVMSAAFFVNLGVWLMEQLVQVDFELLAVSYIISELFLLGLQDTLLEQERLKALVEQQAKSMVAPLDYGNDLPAVDENRLQTYQNGLDSLTPTETTIYEAYLARMTTKEILANLNIKENTLKFHNRNIYSKLGVSSRRELMELHAVLQRESE
ncbi:MAG: helix-turn-helix domain-containing protein [Clostridia bacterium]|nr:helix-turn-helix domain-containing protein [Clostridia bacterium]